MEIGQFLFTIRIHARRNFICHGEIFDLFTSKKFAGLAFLCLVPTPKKSSFIEQHRYKYQKKGQTVTGEVDIHRFHCGLAIVDEHIPSRILAKGRGDY